MLEVLTGAGSFAFAAIFVAVCLLISIFIYRKGTSEASVLKRENHRLRNMLADLVLDNAALKNAK